MNISPLSLTLLLVSFICVQKIHAAEQNRNDNHHQQGMYPSLDFQPAYRSTGPLPIPHQAHQSAPYCGSYPPSYGDNRHPSTSEGQTPPSGYFSDPTQSPGFSQFPPSPGYGYQPHTGYPQTPVAYLLPSAGPLASVPAEQSTEKQGHRRQRSNTFNLGDLSLEAETDEKEMQVPRQLQDSVGIFHTERELLISAAQIFLKRAKEEGRATIDEFNTMNSGDASPSDKRRDSTLGKLTKMLQPADTQAKRELTKKCKDLQKRKEPYEARFLAIAAQCTAITQAFEDATSKLTPSQLDGAQSKS